MKNIKKNIIILLIIGLIGDNLFISQAFAVSEITNEGGVPTGSANISGKTTALPIDLDKMTTNLAELASIEKNISTNGFDETKFKEWTDVGNKLLAARAENSDLWQKYLASNNEITPEIAQTLGINYDGISEYDIRPLEALAYLTADKQNGGAGRELLTIPNLTKGYNVNPDNTRSSKDKTGKEVGEWSLEQNPDAADYISAHSNQWGQAIDISQIDYVRGSAYVYDKDDNLVKIAKIPNKIPIDVSWQTTYSPENKPFSLAQPRNLLSSAFANLFNQNANSAFNNLTAMLAQDSDAYCNLPENNPQVNGDNLTQMVVKNLGLACYLSETELPTDFEPGYDLGNNAKKLGQLITSYLSGNNIVDSGLEGNDYYDLELNIGKEWVGQLLGLPKNTLTATNSTELIKAVGRRTFEDKLNISNGSLSTLSSGNANLNIGRGYITNILNLSPGAFDSGKKTYQDVATHIGTEKAQYLFKDPGFIDRLLGITIGNTQKFTSGQISTDDYARLVGDVVINQIKEPFSERPDLYDAIMGVAPGNLDLNVYGNNTDDQKAWIIANYDFASEPTVTDEATSANLTPKEYFEKNYNTLFANNQPYLYSYLNKYATKKGEDDGLTDKLFAGDAGVFYEAGLRVLSRIFSTSQDMWGYYQQWLSQESDPNINNLADVQTVYLTGTNNVPVIYSDVVNEKLGLKTGDIERMFILDKGEEVFRRFGRIGINNALNQESENDDSEFLSQSTTSSDYYLTDFYTSQFQMILSSDSFQKLLSNSQTKNEAQQMQNLINIALNYKEQNEDDIKYKRRVSLYVNTADQLQTLLIQIIQKSVVNYETTEAVRFLINPLIQGESIPDPRYQERDDIKENYSYYYVTYGTFKDFYDVIHDNISVDEYTQNIGFNLFANQNLDHPNQDVVAKAYKEISSNPSKYQNANTTLKNVIGDDYLTTESQITNNSLNQTSDLLINNDDLVNFLNGTYQYLALKIGSNIANASYETSNFYPYAMGEQSNDDLLNSLNTPYYKDQEISSDPYISTVFGLFSSNANFYTSGMDILSQSTGVDIKSFFTSRMDIQQDGGISNINDLTNGVFNGININSDGKSNVNTDLITDLMAGDMSNFMNRMTANDLAKQFKKLLPDLEINASDFMSPNVLNQILKLVGDSQFDISNLNIPGYFNQIFAEANLNTNLMSFKYGLFANLKESFGDGMSFDTFNDFFNMLMDPNTNSQQMSQVFSKFLDQAGFLDDIPQEYQAMMQQFLSGNIDADSAMSLISDAVFADDPEAQAQMKATMNLLNSLQNGNIDPNTLADSFKKMGIDLPDDQLKELTGVMSALGDIQNGNINAAITNLKEAGIFDEDTADELGDLGEAFNAFNQVQSGDYAGAIKSLEKSGLFGDDDDTLKQMSGTFSAFENIQNGNYAGAITSLKDAGLIKDSKDLDKFTGVMSAYSSIQSGDYTGAITALKDNKVFGEDPPKGLDKFTGVMSAYSSIQSGDYTGAITALKDNKVFGEDPPKGLDKFTGVMSAYSSIQSGDYTGAITALKDNKIFGGTQNSSTQNSSAQSASLDKFSDVLSVYSSVQAGNYTGAITALKNSKLISDSQKASMDKLTDKLSLVEGAMSGDPKAVVTYLKDNTDIFKDLNNNQVNALTGVLGMGMNGDFNVKQVALYGCQYFGFKGVKVGNWGVISPATMINGFSNPMSIASSLASQYLAKALSGAFGQGAIANFATGLVAGLAISLVTSLLGGQGRVEYRFTACGFYPGFNEQTGLVENQAGTEKEKKESAGSTSVVGLVSGASGEIMQLDAVNAAKTKALQLDAGSDVNAAADAWGNFTTLRNKYDTIPTDEIVEDDEATRDEKYTQSALDNENTQAIEAENLTDIVSWAKSKDNESVKCYDMGQNGVFINDEAKLTEDQQKQIAKYKIKVLLGNLLRMGQVTSASETNNYLNAADIPAQAFYTSPTNIYDNVIGFIHENNIFAINTAKAEDTTNTTEEAINSKYKRIFNFNFSGQSLRPTQIYTFGGDSSYPGLITSNTAVSENASSIGLPIDTGEYVAKADNPLYEEIGDMVKSLTTKAHAAAEPFSVENADYESNDVSHFYVLRDKLWGDLYGSPGSQDIQLANGMYRQGFGYFKRMWDRIHIGY